MISLGLGWIVILSINYMVWYAPGVYEKMDVEDIRACSLKVRETRPDEHTFLIVPFERWAETRAEYERLGKRVTAEDKIRRYAKEKRFTEDELNAELQRLASKSGRSSIS